MPYNTKVPSRLSRLPINILHLTKKIMASKKDILRKLKILITRNFQTEEEAFNYFDKNSNATLARSEVKVLLKDAGVNRWISEIAAGQIISKFDEDDNDKLSWKEFKKAIKALANEAEW